MAETLALVVAAGRGRRFGGARPKQYARLAGQPLLRHTLRALRQHPAVSGILTVIHPDDRQYYDAATAGLDLLPPVDGGATRQASVRNGLESLAERRPERVLIHDGARPFLSAAVVDRTLAALDREPAAIAALPVTDTLKRGSGEPTVIAETLPRERLWAAQTPQAFRFGAILEAHRAAAGLDLTDDAAVAERAGLPVALVMGDPANVKVTTEDDLARTERALAAGGGDVRVGNGFDVHRFAPGDHVMLCGIAVPHTAGLSGHSDADVGLHALTDALLGALGAGDIGMHFPPNDTRWRGADSAHFLSHARDLIEKRGGRILHVDVTLVCERPKIGPHRAAMVERIAGILGLAAERVSVKGTTSEGLGFTGRGEGIAAQATATVRLPDAPW